MAIIDLCSLESAKLLIGRQNDSDNNLIGQLITDVSAEFEQYMARTILSGTYTEFLDVHKNQFMFQVEAYPITSVTSIHNDWDRTFGSTTLIDATNYYVDTHRESGSITIDKEGLTTGPGVLKVIYVGGMATGTVDFISKFRDIAGACAAEVAFRYKRKDLGGLVSVASGGTSLTLPTKEQFLPSVQQVLDRHARFGTPV